MPWPVRGRGKGRQRRPVRQRERAAIVEPVFSEFVLALPATYRCMITFDGSVSRVVCAHRGYQRDRDQLGGCAAMDFAILPPEINSGRMYAGPGSGRMLAAAAAWLLGENAACSIWVWWSV